MEYEDIVRKRDELTAGEYTNEFGTLREAGWHRDWVTPIQQSSHDPCGPVVMGTHWSDVTSAEKRRARIKWYGGYDPRKRFNRVLDLALWKANLSRRDVYVTQACHLLPRNDRHQNVPEALWRESYEAVTRHEIRGRPVIALGEVARLVCENYGLLHRSLPHPSARRSTDEAKARDISTALSWAKSIARPSHL